MAIIGKIIDFLLGVKKDPPPPKSAQQIKDEEIAKDLLQFLKKKSYRNLKIDGEELSISVGIMDFRMKYGIYPFGSFRIYFIEIFLESRPLNPKLDITGKTLFDIEKEITNIVKKDKNIKVK